MNFYESIMDAFFEKLRASAQLSQEEALLVLAERRRVAPRLLTHAL